MLENHQPKRADTMIPRSGDPSPEEYRAAGELRGRLRTFAQSTERVLRAQGLTPERYELLLAIRTGEDEGATVGGLAEALGVAQSSVTQLARRTEDAGLLQREVSSADARVRHLRLTKKGERALARAVAGLRPERASLMEIAAPARPARG
jgi:DNA-binding MarR family transcriptional regulator